jgi:lactate racemase
VILKLRYGRGALTADLRGLRCHDLRPSAPRHGPESAELVKNALDRPLDGLPLAELARGRHRVAVLVPDATRKAWLPEVLPLLLHRLRHAGVGDEQVTVLVACGTHLAVPEGEFEHVAGPLPAGVALVQHDSRDAAALAPVGVLPSGLAVRLSRTVLDADLVVAVSKVQHHYFAGFGGGPKMVFPGVAGYDEIQANHAKVIDLAASPPHRHPGCEPGRLFGNPVAEEIAAAARLRPPDLSLLLVEGAEGRPGWAASGSLDTVFQAACRQAAAWYEVSAPSLRRMVVSAGGAPVDDTLIQAHKALDAACRFVEPGGEVLFLAECGQGAGSPAMEPFLADPRLEAIVAALARRYVQYGHTVLRIVEKTARFRIRLVSRLPEELQARLGFLPVAAPGAVLERWREETPGEAVGLMPGPPVYPVLP